MQSSPVLEMRGISKAFPGVQALKEVKLSLQPGEVMALVGENGAGKSTLLKILAGAQMPDGGEIRVGGEAVKIESPEKARELNVAMIYQELSLAPHLTVAENVFVGREPRGRLGLVDFAKMKRETQTILSDALNVDIDPAIEVRHLNLARMQMVEIARALALNANIIVMDEPTSSLAEDEVQVLLGLIKRLARQGVAVIYVSHRLEEVFEVADRIMVLRDGELVGVRETGKTNSDEIVTMMVGRQLEDLYGHGARPDHGEVSLEVRGLSRTGSLHDVGFRVKAGEILGVSGIVGAGRTEMARAVFGVDGSDSGEILIKNRPVKISSPSQAIAAGVGYLPEDRKLQGLFLGMSVRTNVSAACTGSISKNGFIRARQDREMAESSREKLRIRTPSVEQSVGSLSGGNQQKVVLAKWLAVDPEVLILDEPTRGVDIGGKAEIYALIRELARRGIAIVMISSELPEVLGLSDRVAVMREGRMVGTLDRSEADEEKVMALATGTAKGV